MPPHRDTTVRIITRECSAYAPELLADQSQPMIYSIGKSAPNAKFILMADMSESFDGRDATLGQ